MARYKGRVIVNKVDSSGKRIKGKLREWIQKHPKEIYFDSMTEYLVWKHIVQAKIKHEYQPKLELFKGVKTQELKDGKVIDYSQRTISYTPDFYLPDYDVYVEVKGFADGIFKLRWKLFKLKGHAGFIVYSVDDFKNLIKELRKNKLSKKRKK